MILILFLVGYFAFTLLAARLFARRIADLKDYFLAGRSLGALPVALTFAASWFGAASTMGSINAFHDQGLSGAWMIVIPSVCSFVIITFLLARRVARQSYLSQPEAVERHYGRIGRILLAMVILCSVTSLVGSQMVAAGKVFQGIFGLDITLATVISTAAVVAYAMWGGYFTVVVTDIAQVLFIVIGFGLLLGFMLLQIPHDPQAIAHWMQQQPEGFWSLGHNWRENIFLVFTFVIAWSIAPEMWQRMSSTRNPDLAFRAGWQASLIISSLFVLVMAIGILSTWTVGKSDAVLVDLALRMPNEALTAFVLLAFIAAITSTMDSSVNVGSLTLTRDIYNGLLRPNASMKELLWASRIGTVLVVLPALGIALYYQDIIRVLWISADIYACTMFFPVMGILFMQRSGRLSGILAMVFGGLIVLVSSLIQAAILPADFLGPVRWPGWPYSTLVGVIASGFGFCLGYMLERPIVRNSRTSETLVPAAGPQTNPPRPTGA